MCESFYEDFYVSPLIFDGVHDMTLGRDTVQGDWTDVPSNVRL